MTLTKTELFAPIETFLTTLPFETLTTERKNTLQPLIEYIQDKVDQQQDIQLNFICTHNSRRSHLAQIWAQTAAAHFKIQKVSCYSGGTEATALFPMVAQTLMQTGFSIQFIGSGSNPFHAIKFGENEPSIIGFSKTYDDDFNPKSAFAAIMTCTQADEGCPFIAGAEKRIAIPFEDPKVFDGTPLQTEKYEERSIQIATELFYVFSQIKQHHDQN